MNLNYSNMQNTDIAEGINKFYLFMHVTIIFVKKYIIHLEVYFFGENMKITNIERYYGKVQKEKNTIFINMFNFIRDKELLVLKK